MYKTLPNMVCGEDDAQLDELEHGKEEAKKKERRPSRNFFGTLPDDEYVKERISQGKSIGGIRLG